MAGHVKKPKEDKNKKPVVIVEAKDVSPPIFLPITPDCYAISKIKNADGTYSIIRVEVDSKQLATGKVEIIDTATHTFEANEKFRLAVVANGIFA